MIRINLLPHRELKRERRKKDFMVLTGAVVAAAFGVAAMVAFGIAQTIGEQETRNAFLTTETAKLESQIKEIATLRGEIQSLKARQAAVENLQSDRTMPVHMFDELVKHTPEGIFFRSVRQDDQRVTMLGYAQSNERVAELLRNLATQAPWFERPELLEIKTAYIMPNGTVTQTAPVAQPTGPGAKEIKRVFDFAMTASVRNPVQTKPADGAAPPAKKAAAPAGDATLIAAAR